MGAFADYMASQQAAPQDAPVDTSPGDFQRSFGRGLRGAGSQLGSFIGGGAEAAGLPDVAARAHQFAAEQSAAAAQDAQTDPNRVGSFRDVHDLRSGYDYVSGLLGESVPALGAGLAGAGVGGVLGGPGGAALGAAAAMTPLEAGDVIQRQREDPVAMRASAGDRFEQALGAGGASAAAQAIVPAGVAGKLAGTAERVGLRQAFGHAGADVLTQGAAGAGGEAIKQGGVMLSNPDRQFDTEAMLEAGVGGLAAGVPLAGAGLAGHAIHAPGHALGDAAGRVKDLAGSAMQGARDKLASGRETASAGLDAGKEQAGYAMDAARAADPVQSVKDLYDKGTQQAKDFVDRVAAREDVADLGRLAGQTADRVKAMLPELDAERVQRVKDMAAELMDRGGLDEGRRAQLAQAMGDLADKGNQAIVAGMKIGQDATKSFAAKAKGLYDTFAPKVKAAASGLKKSEDYEGIRSAIGQELVPILHKLDPNMFEDPTALKHAADGVRLAVDAFQNRGKEDLSSNHVARLIDIFGDHTVDVLEAVHRVMHADVPAAEAERFYGALNEVRAQQKDTDRTLGLMMRSLAPELQDSVKMPQLRAELAALRAWAERTDQKTEKGRFDTESLRAELERRYGNKVDAVLAAVEKEQAKKSAHLMDEHDVLQQEGMSEAEATALQGKTIFYGRGEDRTGLSTHPDLDPAGDKGQARQALAKATKENPDKTVSFITAKELGVDHPLVRELAKRLATELGGDRTKVDAELSKHGIVAAEGARDVPGRVDRTNIRDVMVKGAEGEKAKSSHYKNDAVFKADGVSYDAIALMKMMKEQFKGEYDAADDKGALHRTGRLFMAGVAALQDHLGKKVEVPDSTVIDHNGTTYGAIKGLDYSPPNKAGEALQKKLDSLRRDYRDAESAADKARISQQAHDLIDAAKISDPSEIAHAENGFDPDPRGNVHELEKAGKVEPLHSDLSGASTEKTGAPSGDRLKPAEIQALKDKFEKLWNNAPSAGAKAVADRGMQLMQNVGVLNKSAHRALFAMLAGKKVSDIASQVNALHEKYKNQFATKAEASRPKNEAKLAGVSRGEAANDNVISFAGKQSEKMMERAKELVRSLSPEDYNTLQHDTMNSDWGHADKLPSALKESFREWVRDNYSGMERETAMARENIDETRRSFYEDLAENGEGMEAALAAAKLTGAQLGPRKSAKQTIALDAAFAKESYPEFKTKAEADKFLVDAYKRWGELRAEDKRLYEDENHPTNELPKDQAKAMSIMGQMFEHGSHADLSSFYDGIEGMSGEANDAIRKMLNRAAPEVAAKDPKGSEVRANAAVPLTASARADVDKYIDDVLGSTVKTEFKNIPHAGEFERKTAHDVVRISVHALNPMSVAYHESLHGFFAKLMDQGNGKVGEVLMRAAQAAPVMNQLRKLLAGEHAALRQLDNPEEAAAYMYQFWANGKLKLGGQTQGVFHQVAAMLRKVFGLWSNDQRAEAIMEYFHSGEFKANLGTPNAVAKALLKSGRNEILEKAKALTKPLMDVVDAVGTAGAQRLRDTGIPAMRELADLMKATGRDAHDDTGFVPAARLKTTAVMNDLGQKLHGYTPDQLQEALEAMQANTRAASPEARMIQRLVQGKDGLLPTMLEYMRQAGVDTKNVQPSKDYFPRKYDAHYISRHQDEFRAVLEKNGIGSKEANDITMNLMASDGAEFTVETDRPGMQHLKQRKLASVSDADLAPFMKKNLVEILSSYVTQASRRGEWARRFGDDGMGITRLLESAKRQGASDEQLGTARKFVRAVDGTLGDGISPGARRVMGNMIVYQNLRLLPLAIFSSVVDPLGIVVRGGTVGDAWNTFKRGVREIPASFKEEFKGDAETELAATLGVIDHATLAHTTGALYMQGMVGDTAKKINDSLFKYNLMEGFNRSMRVGATQAAIRFLERHADGKASQHSERWLAELGLKPGEFDRTLQDTKTRAALNQWVDGAVLRPDAVDKPIWMNDPHYMLIAHLKQFVYSFQETILKRVAHEAQQGNYAPAMAMASYVPVMIASDALKGALQSGGSQPQWKQDWGPADYLGSGIERAGLLGKLQFPADGVTMMAGPTAQQALAVAQAIDGKTPGKAALKALPGQALYSGWVDGGGGADGRVENSMSVD